MMISIKELMGYEIQATDGELGKISDVYFDDKTWKVRYLVVKLGTWFSREKVLLSPLSIKTVKPGQQAVEVALTKKQVQESPDIDTKKTVSREMQSELLLYWRWPLYWSDIGVWGTVVDDGRPAPTEDQLGTHLQSAEEIFHYDVSAMESTHKKIGVIEDILVEDSSWSVKSFVTKPESWMPVKAVLLTPEEIGSISWPKGEVQTSLSLNQVRQLPEYRSPDL